MAQESLTLAREKCNKYDLTVVPCFSHWPILYIKATCLSVCASVFDE
jgi:hypothetical protein